MTASPAERIEWISLRWSGKAAAGRLVVAHHLVVAVEHLARGDQFVAGMVEGAQGGLEVETVLGVHVLTDDRLATSMPVEIGGGIGHTETVRRRRRLALAIEARARASSS